MVQKLFELRKANNSAYTVTDAATDISDHYSDDVILQEAHKALTKARYSPIVSRSTQAAVLKGMILDYQSGKQRRGLGAISVLKAVELLNRMTGYDAPQQVEIKHDVKVNVFPIVGAAFTGELPPLDIIDIDSTVVVDLDRDKPTTPAPDPTQTLEELFP